MEADVQGLSVRSSIMILLAGFPAGTFPQMAVVRLVKSGHSVLWPFETDGTSLATTRLCRLMTTTSPSSIHRRILPKLCCTSRTVVVFTLYLDGGVKPAATRIPEDSLTARKWTDGRHRRTS